MHNESYEAGQEHDRQAKIAKFNEIEQLRTDLIQKEFEIEKQLAEERKSKGLPEDTPYEQISGSLKQEYDEILAKQDELGEQWGELKEELWPDGIEPLEELK